MAVTRMTPSPGAVGVFTVSAPFSVGASTLYTVTALRRFSEVIGSGIDLFTELYEPLSIDKSTFEAHLEANAYLVTLQPDYGAPVLVPDTYITSYPKNDSLRYRRIILGIDFGPLPPGLDLSYLTTILKGKASDILGVEPEVNIMEITVDDTVTQDQHQINEARRQAAIKERDPIYARCETQEKQITALLATQKQLIKLLQDAGINPTP